MRSSLLHRAVSSAMLSVGLGLATQAVAGANLEVVDVEPRAHSLMASVATPIVVRFDRPVDRDSVVSGRRISAFGRWSGAVGGAYAFSHGDTTVSLTPDRPFSSGENVMVVVSGDLVGASGESMRQGGFSYRFWTRAQPAANAYVEIDRLTTRTVPSSPTQAYGGVATDLDADGWLDVTIVNEISADLRVFPNRADGTGLEPFLLPTEPVGNRASPNEPSDFNADGNADLCVANIDDDTVSVLLGNGDGTFAPQQILPVGSGPRGIAVLDADGDGDTDIVNTNSGSGALNMTLSLNDGNGVFSAPTFFPAGASGAWALAAGDMNDDGILDLVIGARDNQRIVVQLGQGDGTFVPLSSQSSAGAVWMLVVGDVNGDGAEDVASVNSNNNNGAIFFGDGSGGLSAPQTYATGPFTLASDLGDVDGDGDLDWVTSSFGGDWLLFANDGTGTFTLEQVFPPTSAASCALPLDVDNDLDLDLALIDEIADEIVLMRNSGIANPPPPPEVPNGTDATAPVRVAKQDALGRLLRVTWSVASCPATGYHIVHGGGSTLPAAPGGEFLPTGSRCGIGADQPFQWLEAPDPLDDPTGLVWFVVVADDGFETEGAWGDESSGAERAGPGPSGASGACGFDVKNSATPCAAARTDP